MAGQLSAAYNMYACHLGVYGMLLAMLWWSLNAKQQVDAKRSEKEVGKNGAAQSIVVQA